MMRIRRKDGRIVTVPAGYVVRDGETIVVGAMFMDSMAGLMASNAPLRLTARACTMVAVGR